MLNLSDTLEHVKDSEKLLEILNKSANLPSPDCDVNKSVIQDECYRSVNAGDNNSIYIPQCPRAVTRLIIHAIAARPNVIDDKVKEAIVSYFKQHDLRAGGLVSQEVLHHLYTNASESQLLSWIKYETVLAHLIKALVYEPKTMANEILNTVKEELDANLASKLSSVLQSCVKHCREVNSNSNSLSQEEEEEEKWCEIIDWMSWFLVSSDDIDP